MKPPDIDLPAFERDFKDALEEKSATELSNLGQLGEAQALFQVFLQNELRRVGADHPRSRSFKVIVDDNFAQIEALTAELEISRIRVPAVDEGDALVHGRIKEAGGRGLPGLVVCLVDRSNEALAGIDPATTDSSGYYSIVVREGADRYQNEARSPGVFLSVFTAAGNLLHRGKQALKLAKGARLQNEVALDPGRFFETTERDLSKTRKESEKTPDGPKADSRQEPSDPPSAGAVDISAALDALEAHDDFESIGAGRAKLERLLAESEVSTQDDLARFVQKEDREVRDQLRLPNLPSARAFIKRINEILEESQ